MAVIVSKGIVVPSYAPPVGTTWLFEENGTFEVPADGKYQIEMHGGGGGGGAGYWYPISTYYYGGGGGGSGTIKTVSLTKGEKIAVSIGAGGANGALANGGNKVGTSGSQGGTTTFGTLSIAGGYGGTFANMANGTGGSASGDIASSGSAPTGGYGNKNNASQTYGNGGAGARGTDTPSAGKPGAVIITFMGVA